MRSRGVWNVDRAQAALNVFGGAAFAVGSLFFLDSALQRLGIALFVAGSFGMLVGALAVWNERYAPRRGRSAPPSLDPASITAPATAPVTSPAAQDTRPASPRGD